MHGKPVPEQPEPISCELCLKEIPDSAGSTMESDDYIYHFCGTACYEQWQARRQQKQNRD